VNNEIDLADKIIEKKEVEQALEKLLYNLTASKLHKPYLEYQEHFIELLRITETWIFYFMKYGSLEKVSCAEIISAKYHFDKIPFEAFITGVFYEEVDIWFDVVVYMSSCPIDEKFNPKSIIKKGMVLQHDRQQSRRQNNE